MDCVNFAQDRDKWQDGNRPSGATKCTEFLD